MSDQEIPPALPGGPSTPTSRAEKDAVLEQNTPADPAELTAEEIAAARFVKASSQTALDRYFEGHEKLAALETTVAALKAGYLDRPSVWEEGDKEARALRAYLDTLRPADRAKEIAIATLILEEHETKKSTWRKVVHSRAARWLARLWAHPVNPLHLPNRQAQLIVFFGLLGKTLHHQVTALVKQYYM